MIKNQFNLLLLPCIIGTFSVFTTPVFSDLEISNVDRQIDLTSQVVRVATTLKVVNNGDVPATEVLFPFPEQLAEKMVFLVAGYVEKTGEKITSFDQLSVKDANYEGSPPALTWFSVLLAKPLSKGDTVLLGVRATFSHVLRPFPEKISRADNLQLLIFQDTAYYLSPYPVKVQLLTVKLAEPKVESYSNIENTKFSGSEIKYGPYENLPPFSFEPIVVHFGNNKAFAVAEELVREVEVSHWGNVQVTECYKLIHGGAQISGEFSRLDYQSRRKGASAFRNVIALLPQRAHSIYYRDEIGNVSTSDVMSDSKKILMNIEPRYPMFGGWRTSFTIGYGLPLKDFLFQTEGKRFINITFGSSITDLVIDNLTVKVVLPEGSKDISSLVPFHVKQSQETKVSHLDMIGRPVVVLKKSNVVTEHNKYFQVYYRFSNLSMLLEPLMLISGFFFCFIGCIIYMHADLTISKTSESYLAKLQLDEVQSTLQQMQSSMSRFLIIDDKLESSLRDISKTGDVQTCKAARKEADAMLREVWKELQPLILFLRSSPHAAQILPKVEELVAKEKELREKQMLKHSTVVESYEKKSGGRDAKNLIVALQQKISALRQEVDDLVDVIDEV